MTGVVFNEMLGTLSRRGVDMDEIRRVVSGLVAPLICVELMRIESLRKSQDGSTEVGSNFIHYVLDGALCHYCMNNVCRNDH